MFCEENKIDKRREDSSGHLDYKKHAHAEYLIINP
jgi:hypothetical protein